MSRVTLWAVPGSTKPHIKQSLPFAPNKSCGTSPHNEDRAVGAVDAEEVWSFLCPSAGRRCPPIPAVTSRGQKQPGEGPGRALVSFPLQVGETGKRVRFPGVPHPASPGVAYFLFLHKVPQETVFDQRLSSCYY